MIQPSSTPDVDFIRHLSTYWNFFLITPWLFDKKATWKPLLAKLYSSFLIVCNALWVFHLTQDDHFNSIFNNELLSQQITKALVTIVLVTNVSLSVVKSAFFDNNNWRLIFDNFRLLDKHSQGVRKDDKISKFYVDCFIKNLIFFAFARCFIWTWENGVNYSAFGVFLISPTIYFYYEFLTTYLLIILVEAFKQRYKFLKKRLMLLATKCGFVHETRTLTRDCQILSETAQIFNAIFGYKIIFMLIHCALEIIGVLNTFYASFFVYKTKNKEKSISFQILAAHLCLVCYLLVSLTNLV